MLLPPTQNNLGQHDEASLWARQLYRRATAAPLWRRLLAYRSGRGRQLSNLNEFVQGKTLAGLHDGGIRDVAIGEICGSESDGRGRDFGDRFEPQNRALAQRWLSVAQAWHQGASLPPVELIQVETCYFIRDGHHRISVAGAAGSDSIVTHVAVREVAGQAPQTG